MLQNPIWPFWGIGFKLSYLLLICLIIYKSKSIITISRNPKVFFNLMLLFAVLIIVPVFTGFMYSNIIYLLTYILSFVISNEDYNKSFNMLGKVLGVISIVSFIPWFINTYISPVFPLYNTIDLSELKGTYYMMDNYLFFVKYNDLFESFRFYSMFDEPGVFGTLAAFILYGNKYDFSKWYVWAIFISSLFTFSMAFYLLTILGLVTIKIKVSFKSIIVLMILGVICVNVINNIEKDSLFYELIIDRLGNLSGSLDARTSDDAKNKLKSIMWTTDFFFGIGKTFMDKTNLRDGESAELFILERGFLTVLVLVSCYFSFIKKITKSTLLLLTLFILSFLQRPFLLTSWQMLLFQSICSYITYNPFITYKKDK